MSWEMWVACIVYGLLLSMWERARDKAEWDRTPQILKDVIGKGD